MKHFTFVFITILILLGGGGLLGYAWLHQYSPVAVSTGGCIDIPASPDYLATGNAPDAITAINNARAVEHVRPLRLNADFYRQDPAMQQFILLNLERTDRGLLPLHLDVSLSIVATAYSRQMRNLGFFSHTSPIAGTFQVRVDSNPAVINHYALVAENLSGNPAPGAGSIYEYMYDDASEACGHRYNILDPQLRMVGIGWVVGSQYGSISAQEFLTSSIWSPYEESKVDQRPPAVSIVDAQTVVPTRQSGPSLTNPFYAHLYARALVEDHVGGIHITWFIDRFGNQPHTGPLTDIDREHLSPGVHTLYVYAVNGVQMYNVARYTFVVG
jgi:uncharacterized protein YkwD